MKGIRVSEPGQISFAWKKALNSDCPVVIDFICDPDVPPLPPHITFKQAKGYMTSLLKGDPNELGIIGQSAKQMMEEFLMKFEK